jgi:hypothetical protein
VINFSVGASSKEYKKINQYLGKDENDNGYKYIKHSEVVPTELFKDEKTTGIGLDRLQAQNPQAQRRLKEVLAKTYNLNINRILTYQEMLQIPEKSTKPIYNVIIVPSLDGDLAAAQRDVLGSYLLIH